MNTRPIFRYAAAAVTALTAFACSIDDRGAPALPDTPGTTAPFTITATMDDAPETRVSAIDDGASKIELKWKNGDIIHIINSAEQGTASTGTLYTFTCANISSDGKTASFTCADYPADATPAYALHASPYASIFNPASMSYSLANFLPAASSLPGSPFPLWARYDPGNRLLVFKPLCAVLKLNITLPAGAAGTLSQIRIGSEEGSQIFYTGSYDITSGTAVRADNTAQSYIRFSGSTSLAANSEQSVYLPVRPGSELSGQALEIDLVVGNSIYTATLRGAKIETGKCYPLTLGAAKWTAHKIYESGTGEQGNPYQIATETNLRALAGAVRAGEMYHRKYFELTTSVSGITTSAADPWLPIGSDGIYFGGNFDGNGHTVSGTFHLSDKNGCYLGFFGNISGYSGCNISNLTLEGDVVYNGSGNPYTIYLGAIAGACTQEITGCAHSGALTAENTAMTQTVYAGGIVGQALNNISGCTRKGEALTVNIPNAPVYAGGIVGFLGGVAAMHTCRNESGITATGKSDTYAGALAGNNSGKVYSCSTFPDGLAITVNGRAQNPAKAIGTGYAVNDTEHID